MKDKKGTFNLSEKIFEGVFAEKDERVIDIGNIREFIKRLKEELPYCVCGGKFHCSQCSKIDKLSGDELSK